MTYFTFWLKCWHSLKLNVIIECSKVPTWFGGNNDNRDYWFTLYTNTTSHNSYIHLLFCISADYGNGNTIWLSTHNHTVIPNFCKWYIAYRVRHTVRKYLHSLSSLNPLWQIGPSREWACTVYVFFVNNQKTQTIKHTNTIYWDKQKDPHTHYHPCTVEILKCQV